MFRVLKRTVSLGFLFKKYALLSEDLHVNPLLLETRKMGGYNNQCIPWKHITTIEENTLNPFHSDGFSHT